MKIMSRKAFLRWEKLRLKGRRYVVARTAVIWGIFFFVTLNLASWAWMGSSLPKIFLLSYPALGLIAGTVIWSINEGRFEEFLAEKKANATRRR